jgi:hypothetical protein
MTAPQPINRTSFEHWDVIAGRLILSQPEDDETPGSCTRRRQPLLRWVVWCDGRTVGEPFDALRVRRKATHE